MRSLEFKGDGARLSGHRLGREAHLVAWPTTDAAFTDQLKALAETIEAGLAAMGLDPREITLMEIFLSDPINQAPRLHPLARLSALSLRGMPPAPPARLAARIIHHEGVERARIPGGVLLNHGDHRELWLMDMTGQGGDAEAQTEALLEGMVREARARGFEPFKHLLRTWIYVHDIDAHYAGMVEGRAAVYARLGFKERARFPASTGIGGDPVDPSRWVMVNALFADLPAEALRRVHAPSHLPPASSYGVAFDRALSVQGSEKRAIHISGTASIDSAGQILHEDAAPQAARTLDNITALLKDADAAPGDMAWLLIYLRDIREAARVEVILEARGWGAIPRLILEGPVCRPGWLVEIEGLAWVKI